MKIISRRFYDKVRKTPKQVLIHGKVYDNLDEMLVHEGGKPDFKGYVRWKDLPKYEHRRDLKRWSDYYDYKISSLDLEDKWIEGSDGTVVQIIGILRGRFPRGDKYGSGAGYLTYIAIDTIFGRTRLLKDEELKEREWPGKFTDYPKKYFVEMVASTRNLFLATKMCYPTIWKATGGDPYKIMHKFFTNKTLNYEFFYYLRLLMSQDQIDNLLNDSLPFETSLQTIKNLMQNATKDEVKLKAATWVADNYIALRKEQMKAAMAAKGRVPTTQDFPEFPHLPGGAIEGAVLENKENGENNGNGSIPQFEHIPEANVVEE